MELERKKEMSILLSYHVIRHGEVRCWIAKPEPHELEFQKKKEPHELGSGGYKCTDWMEGEVCNLPNFRSCWILQRTFTIIAKVNEIKLYLFIPNLFINYRELHRN